MANQKTRMKRREKRQRDLRKHQEPDELDADLDPVESSDVEPVAKESEEGIEKEYEMEMATPMMAPGPVSYEELDAAKAAHEKAEQVREETWTVQELVYNIAYSQMTPEEKGKAIVQVGNDFGKRLKMIATEEMEKSADMDLLELRALLGRDGRSNSIAGKALDFLLQKFDHSTDSKSAIRKQLKSAADTLERDPIHEIRSTLPDLMKSAKQAGIGGDSPILIEKDASGQWRAVLLSSNNFKDRDGEIIAQSAHEEYVSWINKNMESAPVFATWHIPGTARTHPIDFIGFENGFLVESCPLLESEAAALLKMQAQMDLGLSIGGIALARDPKTPHVILKYRQFEVSDLPLSRAANPFTDIELVTKEADMKSEEMQKYLTGMLGEERAKAVLEKMALSQDELRKAGVEEKEKASEPVVEPAAPVKDAPAIKMDEIVERVAKELGMQELSDEFKALKETADKVPVLEELVKQLLTSKDNDLAEMIQPPITRQLAWKNVRPSQSQENVLKKEDEEDKKLEKAKPELGWLSEATGTTPVYPS